VALVPAAPRATLVFLHGSGGNFASYWYVLADLARRHDVAVICPSFGLGNWQRPGGVAAVFRALDHATRRYDLDGRPTYLAALSNGGRGATRVMAHSKGRRFRGVVLLSAVLEAGPLGRGVRRGAWRGKRVLVIHGTRDRRIPWGHVRTRLRLLRAGGAGVQVRAVRGEDHFLFFSRREQVIERVARWVGGR
jgi:pimeloyl-ACP methyl ester carboxylesterase